ncbi:MAG TPA: SPOR domain-containing protein [Solirubrobacterales bacterium]|nr:SPOR domain-containing protein [Solirubrobacterales bacterium]
MNDDWRLRIDFRDDGVADALQDRLDARDLEHDLSQAFHDRVIVSRGETTIFLYAGDREQAERARALVERYATENDEDLEVEFTRWHPLALDWEPADEPLPADAEARAREHQERVADERRESEEQGYPMYEVRIDLPSRDEAEALADRLRAEGVPTVHRWKYVLIGAADEEAARELEEQVRGELPAGSQVRVEATWPEMMDHLPPNPFSFMGGLGG